MTIAEGGGRRAVSNKLRDMYIPTLKANYIVWPAVQIVNFRLMPVQFQLVSGLRDPGTIRPLVLEIHADDTFVPALCFHDRYCMDRLPVPVERSGGCRREQDPPV